MSIDEFNIQSDILYNNATSNQAPPLNAYEKSVLLTKSQESLVQELYKGYNGEPFESTESSSQMLKHLLRFKTIDFLKGDKIYRDVIRYIVAQPEDMLYATLEKGILKKPDCPEVPFIDIKPCKQDNILDIIKNPFKGPMDKALKVYLQKGTVGIYSSKQLSGYEVHYIKKPLPIVLEDFPEHATIDGHFKKSEECELHPYVHTQILARAVQLGKEIWKVENDEPQIQGYNQQS